MKVNRIPLFNTYYKNNSKTNTSNSFRGQMSPDKQAEYNDLRVFNHHIYEYKKGLRNLVLTTEPSRYKKVIEHKLKDNDIDYIIHDIGNNNINVYFGEKQCVDVVKTFDSRLNRLSPEQDFMLGIMLGYDRVKQCGRYQKIKNKEIKLGIPQE